MKIPKPKPGQANKDELLMFLRSLVPAGHVEAEFRFHPVRMWRFDYAIPKLKIAVDYQGHAGFVPLKDEHGNLRRDDRGKPLQAPSGHSTIKGLTNDCEKSNEASAAGWRFFTFTALHFREKDRKEHKLRSPWEVLEAAVKDALATTPLEPREAPSQPSLL